MFAPSHHQLLELQRICIHSNTTHPSIYHNLSPFPGPIFGTAIHNPSAVTNTSLSPRISTPKYIFLPSILTRRAVTATVAGVDNGLRYRILMPAVKKLLASRSYVPLDCDSEAEDVDADVGVRRVDWSSRFTKNKFPIASSIKVPKNPPCAIPLWPVVPLFIWKRSVRESRRKCFCNGRVSG